MLGAGDRLARGASKASFVMHDGHLRDERWEKAFGNLNVEKFKQAPNKARQKQQPQQLELPLTN